MRIVIAGIGFDIAFQKGLSLKSDYLQNIFDFCREEKIRRAPGFSVLITSDPTALPREPEAATLRPWGSMFFTEIERDLFFCMDTFACLTSLQNNRAVIVIDPRADAGNIVAATVDFLKLITAHLVMERGGILLHCSAVAAHGEALAFAAASGGGKSTIAALLAPQWRLLNDECNAVLPGSDGFIIHATPFARPDNLPCGHNEFAKLKKLFILEKAGANSTRPLALQQRFSGILANMYITATAERQEKTMLGAIEEMAATLPVEILAFKNTPAIVDDISSFI
jgi:hypothetical protein